MAQYYSPFFQSGLKHEGASPAASRSTAPVARRDSSATAATASDAASIATTDTRSSSYFFVFGKSGSLHAPSRAAHVARNTPPVPARTQPPAAKASHSSFLSMDASDPGAARSALAGSSQTSSSSIRRHPPNLPIAPSVRPTPAVPQPRHARTPSTGSGYAIQAPPSPSLSVKSSLSYVRKPPSPTPSVQSTRSAVLLTPTAPRPDAAAAAGAMRAPSNASSLYRRTNRGRALAALEGGGRLHPVPEARSFVPFDSEDEDEPRSEDGRFARFVQRTRAAADRERAAREREPPSFIDLEEDAASMRARAVDARRRSVAVVPGRTGWQAPPPRIASAA